MKTIIAGSRSITDYLIVKDVIQSAPFTISEVVSGRAPGVDELGEQWANENNVPIQPFPADWDNLDAPGAVIKENRWGKKYNARAGHDRNKKMAQYAQALIAIWDGKSPGTKDMMALAMVYKLIVFFEMRPAKNSIEN